MLLLVQQPHMPHKSCWGWWKPIPVVIYPPSTLEWPAWSMWRWEMNASSLSLRSSTMPAHTAPSSQNMWVTNWCHIHIYVTMAYAYKSKMLEYIRLSTHTPPHIIMHDTWFVFEQLTCCMYYLLAPHHNQEPTVWYLKYRTNYSHYFGVIHIPW